MIANWPENARCSEYSTHRTPTSLLSKVSPVGIGIADDRVTGVRDSGIASSVHRICRVKSLSVLHVIYAGIWVVVRNVCAGAVWGGQHRKIATCLLAPQPYCTLSMPVFG